MPRDLDELLRQRRLIQEHLTWLDREVARLERESGIDPRIAAPASPLPVPPQLVETSIKPSETDVEAEEILSRYQQEPKNLQGDVKRGCITAMIVVLVLFFGAAVTIWFFTPHPSAEKTRTPAPAQR